MPKKKYVVQLTDDERRQCRELVRRGEAPARSIMHAQVLLKAEARPAGPGWTDAAIQRAFGVSHVTVGSIRQTLVTAGLSAALDHYRIVNREYPHKLDGLASYGIEITGRMPIEAPVNPDAQIVDGRLTKDGAVLVFPGAARQGIRL